MFYEYIIIQVVYKSQLRISKSFTGVVRGQRQKTTTKETKKTKKKGGGGGGTGEKEEWRKGMGNGRREGGSGWMGRG